MKVDTDVHTCGTPHGGISHPFHFYQSSVIISQLRDVISVEVDVTAQRCDHQHLSGEGTGTHLPLAVTAGSPAGLPVQTSQVGPLTAMSRALSGGEVGAREMSTS